MWSLEGDDAGPRGEGPFPCELLGGGCGKPLWRAQMGKVFGRVESGVVVMGGGGVVGARGFPQTLKEEG